MNFERNKVKTITQHRRQAHKVITITMTVLGAALISILVYAYRSQKKIESQTTHVAASQKAWPLNNTNDNAHIKQKSKTVDELPFIVPFIGAERILVAHTLHNNDESHKTHESLAEQHVDSSANTLQELHKMIDKHYTHCPFFVDNTHSVLPQLQNDARSLGDIIVDVYKLEYMLLHGLKFDEIERQRYVDVSEQLYRYVLRDVCDYKQFILRSKDATLVDSSDIFNKMEAFECATTQFVDTLLPIAADETLYMQQLKETFYDKLNMLVELVYLTLCHERKDTMCLLSETHIEQVTPQYTHNVMVHQCELPLYELKRVQNNGEYIYLGGGVKLVKSYTGLMHNVSKHVYIDHGPYMMRDTLLPYVLTQYDDNNINIGHRIMMAVSPQQEVNIPYLNTRVSITNDECILIHDVQEINIVYVCGSIQSLEQRESLSLFMSAIDDITHEMQDIFVDYSGTTCVVQRMKEKLLKQLLVHSSLVPLADTGIINAQYNEYNVVPDITFGSCVIKQCLEIIDAFFIAAIRDIERNNSNTGCSLHTQVYIAIDASEQNIYDAPEHHINHMFFKTMSCIMGTIMQHEQSIINKLLSRTSQLDKSAIKYALKYLQQLQIHIIGSDIVTTIPYDAFTQVDKLHSDITQIILEAQKHLRFARLCTLQEISQCALLNPQKAIDTLNVMLLGHVSQSSNTAVLKQKILHLVTQHTYHDAVFSLLYKKYELEKAEYYNKQHGLDTQVPVCKHKTRTYGDIQLLQLRILEQLKIIHNYAYDHNFDMPFSVLMKDIQNIHTCLDAQKILSCLGDVDHVTKLCEDADNIEHTILMAVVRCNSEIHALYT